MVDPSQAAHVTVVNRLPRVWAYKSVELLVDNQLVGKIRWRGRSSLHLEVLPGAHTLTARIGVLSSAPARAVFDAQHARTFEVRWSRQIGLTANRDANLLLAELAT